MLQIILFKCNRISVRPLSKIQNKAQQIKLQPINQINIQKVTQMEKYILNTPKGSDTKNTLLYNTTASINEEDCPYCVMKRKFNIGNSSDQRCLQHSLKINFDFKQQINTFIEEDLKYIAPQQLVEILLDVEESLDYYWQNLREVSGGNPASIHKQLQPVLHSVKRIQQKMNRFYYDNMDLSQITPLSQQKKMLNSHSEKILKIQEFSNILDPQENQPAQSIKQWVMYFQKILQTRRIPQTHQLTYDTDLEMRIFKQTMERKFIQFVEQLNAQENKVKDSLTRLIFYMQKSSQNVEEKQIEEDIKFIEGENVNRSTCLREADLERLLLIQAESMERILSQNTINNSCSFLYI